MADHHGSAGVVAEVARELRGEVPSEAEQLDLLVSENRPAGDLIRWDKAKVAAEAERTRKAGRPNGAQNLATRELKRWLVQLLGRTPQEWRVRWLMIQPEELARRLGCSVAEAWDRQDRIAQSLQGYFMANMQPVDDQGRAVPLVALSIGGQVGQANGAQPWSEWFQGAQDAGPLLDVTPEEGA
ncbi:hypothetical protein [Bosea minatitlanensis]|uniref:Uncharacterized protein n=1 Tax=Bosea minatitlanensis TaxID=128782 RepID=A0ABW0EZ55_9HYPH|nr:hypothetical protein [Bosea minatitlanensis]MCT4495388.1 hypothetical protein [Bosea minatitlanensis]